MFIKIVDDALERLLRERLPLSEEVGDVTFDSPTSNWSAQLSRVTVNLFLYDVTRSSMPARAQARTGADGRPERRGPLPMMQLSYLVSAWAGSPSDEHQLLGDVISRLAAVQAVPEEFFTTPPGSTVTLDLGDDTGNKAREVWSALGGQLKASFALRATIAADTYDWVAEAPLAQRIEAITKPVLWRAVSHSQVVKK